MIDLHTHSTASDGTFSPTILIRHAFERGLHLIALTDHDTVGGVEEAQKEATKLGIRCIAGAEFEIQWDGSGTFHLLALNIDPKNEEIIQLIQDAKSEREERNSEIINKFSALGLEYDWQLFKEDLHVIGRPHFAEVLVKMKQASDIQDAFNRFLTPGKPLYEPRRGLDFKEAIHSIHKANGRGFIAHPHSLHLGWEELGKQVRNMQNDGLDGLEVWHPGIGRNDGQRLMDLCSNLGLKMSAGSDFHGASKPDRMLGKTLKEKYTIKDEFEDAIS